jgi:hypothetical protein
MSLGKILSFLRNKIRRAPAQVTPPISRPPSTALPTDIGPVKRKRKQATPAPSRSERTLIVGVDFGTSATKVIWQDLSDNRFEVFRWSGVSSSAGSFLFPSTVTFRAGRLHFGLQESEVLRDDIRLLSIKLCVLCRGLPSICRCGNAKASQGMIHLPAYENSTQASSITCLFLAFVFREVETRLRARYPNDNLIFLWNLGCPMDHLDDRDRQTEWERMAGVAMGLRTRISNPVNGSLVAEASEMMKVLMVPDQCDRNYFVQPEGFAAVKAFLESPHSDSKTYAIVDVGAGTTEVSFLFNGRAMAEIGQPFKPSYLADSTEAIGGGKIDLELAQAWGCDVMEARRRKEQGKHDCPRTPTIESICLQYRKTCARAARERKLVSLNDKRFDLFVIGGGGRLAVLKSALKASQMPGGFVLERSRPLQPPKSLKDKAQLESSFDLLAIACGLASSLDWEYFPPREVESMGQPAMKMKPDVDELYPK